MKIRKWTAGLAALALYAAPATAQTSADAWSYDNHVQGVAFASDCCEPSCGSDDCCADDSCCGDDCCGDPCCGDACGCGDAVAGGLLSGGPLASAIEGVSLASMIGLADDSQYQIGGWSQIGWHDANDGVFNTRPHEVQLQQQWLYLGRVADGSKGFDVGGRVDLLYGTDASNTQAFGNNPGNWDFQNGWDHGAYGWAMPQAYGEVAMGDLSVKIGHFFTLLGYQVVPATGNFFYSIPYTFNFSEAFTHTGALATYKMSDTVTAYGGWTLGWDTGFDQLGNGNSFLGGASVQVMDALNVTVIQTIGDLGWIGDNGYTHSIVANLNITDNLNYVAQSDVVDVENSPASGGGRYDTFGINQYLFYTLTDTVKTGARIEWWKADGVSLYEMAYGLNVKMLSNVMIRPEIRYNWCPSDTLPFVVPVASAVGNATAAGDYQENTIVGCDAIMTF